MLVRRPPFKLKVNQEFAVQNPQKTSVRAKKSLKDIFCGTPCTQIQVNIVQVHVQCAYNMWLKLCMASNLKVKTKGISQASYHFTASANFKNSDMQNKFLKVMKSYSSEKQSGVTKVTNKMKETKIYFLLIQTVS